jgi:dihydrolipoamide dehydrogenase
VRASSSPSRSPGLNPAPIDYDGVPRVTYSEPEVASVGITEAQAAERYGDSVETVTYDLAGNGKSQILKTAGFVKLVRQKDGPVVGVHMVGSRVGELLAEAQLIYNWEALPAEVAQLIHATRRSPRRWARRTSRSPASRCTRTADAGVT